MDPSILSAGFTLVSLHLHLKATLVLQRVVGYLEAHFMLSYSDIL